MVPRVARGAKAGHSVRGVLPFMLPKPKTYEIDIWVDNEGAIAMAANPLRSGRSKYIHVM